jgi:cyclopropane fatty-acyl-phospholipid synthase-like methyltransferase
MDRVYKFWTAFKRVMVALFVITFIIAAIHFPYDVDAPLSSQEIEAARKYYTEAYQKPVSKSQVESEYETKYVRESEAMAKLYRVEEKVSAFVKRFNLSDRPVLEIGSGRGYLQDVAQNYTGLDISPSVARFYHKKFILGSATAMPLSERQL